MAETIEKLSAGNQLPPGVTVKDITPTGITLHFISVTRPPSKPI